MSSAASPSPQPVTEGRGPAPLPAAPQPERLRGRLPALLDQGREVVTWLAEPSWRIALEQVAAGVLLSLPAVMTKGVISRMTDGDVGYVGYVIWVVVAAWFAGFPAGAALTLIVGFANSYLYLTPVGGLVPLPLSEQVRLATWFAGGTLLTIMIRVLRRQRDSYQAALEAQRRLAKELASREQRLQVVLAASNTATWDADLTTRRQTWSPELFDQFGLPGPEAPEFGAGFAEMDEPSQARLRAAMDRALRDGSTIDVEVRIVRPDGQERFLALLARPFIDPDTGSIRLVGSSRDLTLERQLEAERDGLRIQEERAKEFQTALIDVLSHELRTPMTTIFGASEMLSRTSNLGEADRTELIGDIHAEAVRMEGLVENLLFLSRAQRGTLDAAHEPVHLGRILPPIVAAEASRWPDLQFRLEMPEEVPVAAGDDSYVERILANLLSNAGKYGRDGGAVDVQVVPDDREVTIRVLDRGIGINPEEARQAFELFYRSDAAARHASGSGVGLYVCARLVEAMGGRIEMRPRDGGGTEASFTLELAEAMLAEATAGEGTSPSPVVGDQSARATAHGSDD